MTTAGWTGTFQCGIAQATNAHLARINVQPSASTRGVVHRIRSLSEGIGLFMTVGYSFAGSLAAHALPGDGQPAMRLGWRHGGRTGLLAR